MNDLLFKNKYRVPSIRLKGFDYGQNASYFVTICTKDRKHDFGKIKPKLQRNRDWEEEFSKHEFLEKTEIAKIAIDFWEEIPKHNPFVTVDTFVVMPNHVHGILLFDKSIEMPNEVNLNNVIAKTQDSVNRSFTLRENSVQQLCDIPFADFDDLNNYNRFGPQSKNLSSVIRGYKGAVKTQAVIKKIDFSWQPRFHDRIIRNIGEYERIKNYILNNPINWNSTVDPLLMHR